MGLRWPLQGVIWWATSSERTFVSLVDSSRHGESFLLFEGLPATIFPIMPLMWRYCEEKWCHFTVGCNYSPHNALKWYYEAKMNDSSKMVTRSNPSLGGTVQATAVSSATELSRSLVLGGHQVWSEKGDWSSSNRAHFINKPSITHWQLEVVQSRKRFVTGFFWL